MLQSLLQAASFHNMKSGITNTICCGGHHQLRAPTTAMTTLNKANIYMELPAPWDVVEHEVLHLMLPGTQFT